ncbi:MAG: DUF1553 domain-containing protein [Zavarzinella sp.]
MRSIFFTAVLCVGVGSAICAADKPTKQLPQQIDQLFANYWQENGIKPAEQSSDSEFFRRVHLDVTGRIPSVADTRQFLKNTDPEKRTKLIESLVEKAISGNFVATILRDRWIATASNNPQLQFYSTQFQSYMTEQWRENTPLDEIVFQMITASINGTLPGNPVYNAGASALILANERKPEKTAAAVSRMFLGISIECAECHNHPFSSYKRTQFWEFSAFFGDVDPQIANSNDFKLKSTVTIPDSKTVVEARFLDGKQPKFNPAQSPRIALAEWVTSKENPFFARQFVNSLWEEFTGLPLVPHLDDESDATEIGLKVLQTIADEFKAHQYDIKWLVKTILQTRVYGLSSKQSDPTQAEPIHFARMSVRGLKPEQLLDSLAQATGLRNVNSTGQQFNNLYREFLDQFASTDRAVERHQTILQALTLMNGSIVTDQTSLEKSEILAGVVDAPFWKTKERIETLFLASLNRLPTAKELEKLESYVERGGSSNDQKKALSDLFWALLNSAEFSVNH